MWFQIAVCSLGFTASGIRAYATNSKSKQTHYATESRYPGNREQLSQSHELDTPLAAEWVPMQPIVAETSSTNRSSEAAAETIYPPLDSEYFSLFFQDLVQLANILTEQKLEPEYNALENVIHRLFAVLSVIANNKLQVKQVAVAATGEQKMMGIVDSRDLDEKPTRRTSIFDFLVQQLLNLLRPILPTPVYRTISDLLSGPLSFGRTFEKIISFIKNAIDSIFFPNSRKPADRKSPDVADDIRSLIDQLERALKDI